MQSITLFSSLFIQIFSATILCEIELYFSKLWLVFNHRNHQFNNIATPYQKIANAHCPQTRYFILSSPRSQEWLTQCARCTRAKTQWGGAVERFHQDGKSTLIRPFSISAFESLARSRKNSSYLWRDYMPMIVSSSKNKSLLKQK